MTEASARGYPRRNPFPNTATTSQDERSATRGGRGALGLTTVDLPAVTRMRDVAQAYLAGFAAGDEEYGQIAFVHGDHGSGKTHAVLYMLREIVPALLETDTTKPWWSQLDAEPYLFYVKAEDGDFVTFYQRLMGQLDLAAWRDISLRFLGRIASEEVGKLLGEAAEADFLERVRANPQQVYELSEQLRIEPGAVLQTQLAELSDVAGGSKEDFQRALTFLLDPVLCRAAYTWLVGREVPAELASRLGVSGLITAQEQCRYGIQLLVSMCTRIHRSVIIVLDQCERLVLAADGALSTANAGLLHSLVETVPKANGMLVLVGSEDAWSALPPDFRQRIGSNAVPAPALTPPQASMLLAAYVDAVTGTAGGDPYPFTGKAVQMLLELSGGNTRRLLQQAWEVFEQAPRGAPISPSFVERTAERGRGRITGAEAMLAIETVLFDVGVTFVRDWRRDSIEADYAIPAGKPRMLIRFSQAVFYDEEAQVALGHANLIRQVQRAGLSLQVVLIVLGYCSPDVLGQLKRAAHLVIIYDGPAAAEGLRAVVSQPSSPDTPASAARAAEAADRVEEAISELGRTAEARDREVDALRDQVGSLLGRFAEAAEPSARGTWALRRQQLRDRIRDERKERRRQEFADLEAAHERAERDRRNRFLIGGATGGGVLVMVGAFVGQDQAAGRGLAVALIVLGFLGVAQFLPRTLFFRRRSLDALITAVAGFFATGIGAFVYLAAFRDSSFRWATAVPITQALLISFGALFAAAYAMAGFSVLAPRRERDLGRPADSIERLNQAARSYATAGGFGYPLLSRPRPRDLLKDDDPHFRYAAVITAPSEPDPSGYFDRALADAFRTEPTVVVRRGIARALGGAAGNLVRQALRDGIEAGIPETVYLAEAAGSGAMAWLCEQPGSAAGDTPAVLLAEINLARKPGTAAEVAELGTAERGTAELVAAVARAADPSVPASVLKLLRRWYANEGEMQAHRIPERLLSRAAALLSPFEKDGLGTFDELTLIPDIDDAYLYFEQLICYREFTRPDEYK